MTVRSKRIQQREERAMIAPPRLFEVLRPSAGPAPNKDYAYAHSFDVKEGALMFFEKSLYPMPGTYCRRVMAPGTWYDVTEIFVSTLVDGQEPVS